MDGGAYSINVSIVAHCDEVSDWVCIAHLLRHTSFLRLAVVVAELEPLSFALLVRSHLLLLLFGKNVFPKYSSFFCNLLLLNQLKLLFKCGNLLLCLCEQLQVGSQVVMDSFVNLWERCRFWYLHTIHNNLVEVLDGGIERLLWN